MDLLSRASLPALPPLRLAVVGHVEWVSVVGVETLPQAGRVGHARSFLEEPAGGGAVVAVQLARLLGRSVPFFTALGRDRIGEQAAERLTALGLELHVAWRDQPTRHGVSFVDGDGERAITVIGERLAPRAFDPLPWEELAACDGAFLTAADAAAVRHARAAKVLCATPRTRLEILREAAVPLEALIAEAGGFEGVPAGEVAALVYVGLGATRPGFTTVAPENANIPDLRAFLARAHADFVKLIAEYADPATPYLSRPRMQYEKDAGDYDHLARVAEWSAGGGGDE